MAESLILPIVRGVTAKAADELVQSVTRVCGAVDDDRRKLQRQLLAVQCTLADAEVKSETNLAVKRWMKDLDAAAYEADDVLDDFEYEALRRDAQVGDSTTGKVLGYFTPQSPLLFHVTMSSKLSNVLNKINELVEEMNRFGLSVERIESQSPQGLKPPYHQMHSAALDDSSDIVGRDDDKEVVVKLLLDQRDEQKLQVLPVVGMGGLGKTTLAKMVYNDTSVRDHFQLKMWHCVSEKFEAVPLLKSIIELATNKRCQVPDTIELLRRQLEEAIGSKRFLLVLDDVWNEDENKWQDELRPLLCSAGGGHGSVVVVTTRSQQVASIMGTMRSHELACLNDDDSWELFSKKAFSEEVQEEAELVTIGRLIVKKCRGLPLALKAMGGLMSSKQQVKEWKTIADSARDKDEILSILQLSYRHLPSDMKRCFAFCSVFPRNHEMDKEVLIQLWMANGFIQEDGTMDLEQKGEYIFQNLVWRSFLQDVKAKKTVDHLAELQPLTIQQKKIMEEALPYESIGCKMHDLMHDLAKDVAYECVTSEHLLQHEASVRNVRHMNISSTFGMHEIIEMLQVTSSLRTWIVSSPLCRDLKNLRLASLRALVIEKGVFHYHPVMSSHVINYSKHLRYIDLSMSQIVVLPSSICVMYNLQTLRLNGCSCLKYLPESMGKMRKLQHLYLLGCDSLVRMPPNFGLLNNLRTLTTFVLDTEVGCGIDELKNLRHLANRLELYNLRKINCRNNGKEANLHQKENLSELLLYWGRDKSYTPENNAYNEEEVLESLTPHSKLKVLELHGYSGLKIPQWMRDPQMLQRLTTLRISNCSGCKDLSTLWLSVSLEHLDLSYMSNLTTLCKNVGVEAEGYTIPQQVFPKLKCLKLEWLSSLEKWAENTAGETNNLVTIPELEMLQIFRCGKLAGVPHCPVLKELDRFGSYTIAMNSLTHLTSLSKLNYVANSRCVSMPLGSWPSLVGLVVRSSTHIPTTLQVETNQGQLENLRSLSLFNCFTVASGSSEMRLGLWKCFAFVEVLHIHLCLNLVCWPTEELTSLIHLRHLYIEHCHKLEGKGSSSEEKIMSLSHLEKLHIQQCYNLLEIPMLPASLEDLRLESCERLVALPSNLGNLAMLRHLYLMYCYVLKEFPDGMDGLISLEILEIQGCAGIEEFPQGLLQRLPTIKELSIQGCPGLEKRCREGGEYFDLVSSVQRICIPEATTEMKESRSKSNLKKLVKWLIPSC
uniref:Uncharacterized protein n=1 Tax=Oryza punctata TaxID=4537 RepID=A0A0E0LXJ5_ORYPU